MVQILAEFLSNVKLNINKINIRICFEDPDKKIGPSIDINIDELIWRREGDKKSNKKSKNFEFLTKGINLQLTKS